MTTSLTQELLDILQDRPCIECGREGPNELAIVGTHSKSYRGAPLRRPVCVGCLARLREAFGMVKVS